MSQFQIQEILGQEVAINYINVYLSNIEKIPPLLIFYGPSSVGKLSLAERFSYNVLCKNTSGCGYCESCKSFLNHNHPDFIVFPSNARIGIGEEKDAAEFTIRWLLSRRLNYKPHLSTKRIILFPDATLINNEAESALLKSLEEPPEHSRFIFIVDDLSKMKQTILSRAICIPFQYLNLNIVKEISERNSLYREDFFGGSIIPFDIPPEVISLTRKKIEESFEDGILLLELENWIYMYKDSHPEWEEDFNFIEFLELFSTILIYLYSRSELKNKNLLIEYVFKFKMELHKKIPALENIALSELFFSLMNILSNET
jgi:DNA polymerase III subunit gamma/tau